MRYIDKSVKFDLLDKYKDFHTMYDKPWDEFKNPDKTVTHNYILKTQKYLCAYCEQKLEEKNVNNNIGHLEHIIPRDENKELTFDYANLVVCCQGFDIEEYREKIKSGVVKRSEEFCAPKKGSEHNQNLFLNPVAEPLIEDYFDFQIVNSQSDPRSKECIIFPNESRTIEEKEKAMYTINLLFLNHNILKTRRAKVYDEFTKQYSKAKEQSQFLDLIFDESSNELNEFFSMLKKKFGILEN
ncbi:MAG TPA: TIGR02646 family protein [Leptospiraceae bacterium]|nr:TIGR02646 family protein [Leptospiraceae bacterium]HRG73344.1 TIGR02646 family protein [Leptospiraceae bacterium]